MGRAKKKRTAKRRNNLKKRNMIRQKMGKPVFFTLTHCSKKLAGISNKYNYKANMHGLCFVGAKFFNVKYQASIMTDCNFRDAHLLGVDFYNCNMREDSFKNAVLENVVFYNCNLKDVDFYGTKFKNVVFVCTNMNVVKNLDLNDAGILVLRTYNKIEIEEKTENILLDLSANESIYAAKVIHVNKGKLNNWNLSIIQNRCGMKGIEKLSKILKRKERWNNLFTVYAYINLIEKMH